MKHKYTLGSKLVEVLMCIANKDGNDIPSDIYSTKLEDKNKAYNNKIKRNGFTLDEFIKISELCGFSIIITNGRTQICVDDLKSNMNSDP